MTKSLSEQLRVLVTLSLSPGERFPTFDELEQQYDTSRGTAQRVVAELKRDGFLYSAGRLGTFVTDRPPHLNRYGIVLDEPTTQNRFLASLVRDGTAVAKEMDGELATYEDLDIDENSPVYHRLLQDCKARRLAGLIFARHPARLEGTELMKLSGVPIVAITHEPTSDIPRVNPDNRGFITRSLDWLAERGRHRIATLSLPRHPNASLWPEEIASRGGEIPERWRLVVGKDYMAAARNIAELLFSLPDGQRPDSLIITDDNLVEHALAGVVASGVLVGRDVDVVTHCNWPHPVPSILPVCRLGYDVREVFRTCIETLESIRNGEDVPSIRWIGPLFEEEVSAHEQINQ